MSRFTVLAGNVKVRHYRVGHGDCFLIATPGKEDSTYYILIDCGFKPGSQKFLPNKKFQKIVDHIAKSTGNVLDLVIITHEHQDHVNGFWKKNNPYFGNFTIKETWLAWTEDPNDELANTLRKKHKDQLLGLVEARHQLALALGSDDSPAINRIDTLLNLEIGGDKEHVFNRASMLAAAKNPSKSRNKQSMKLVKDKAREHRGVKYLNPGDYQMVDNGNGLAAYVLGPPRNAQLLGDEDPRENEEFSSHSANAFSFGSAVLEDNGPVSPFRREYQVEKEHAFGHGFFKEHYGENLATNEDDDLVEAPNGASWRRIDAEWLYAAENLALKLNRGINNTSLVLGFELPNTKKVLLFAADAQRGNWISWDDQTWQVDGKTVTAKEVLKRTVLYKVGHHASHNATLNGSENDNYPNLVWMAKGEFAQEFTCMITAVNEWAMTKNNPPWRHPLPAIKKALVKKARGRVLQTDESALKQPDAVSDVDWQKFMDRVVIDDLYFEYTILDS